jgi:hypothetical protein
MQIQDIRKTDVGKNFGISAIAVGKILIEAELKDPSTKLATEHALSEGYAKSTPLKDGTPYFMWNIEKIRPLISKEHQPLSRVDFWVNEVRNRIKEAEKLDEDGNDKLAIMLYDSRYEEVPKDIKEEVKEIIEKDKGVTG